ncbi:hypothetical protein BQ9231_00215 [Cedratvirus lausannensis]|uniref:Uncharacterized protein n=1 Tax=Cedratvirus lausannensis TaxID=2023205 RepID=A0A285PWR2_9VIRU|nr:hypothetical protein BQ9231_00215 [Cedratvirus lausannensis]
MDPSIYAASVVQYDSYPAISSYVSFLEEGSPQGYVSNPLPNLVAEQEKQASPFSLPLRNFIYPEALLYADMDFAFSFALKEPAYMWAFPTGEYPAGQAFFSSYLTPRLIGNYNIGVWDAPGLEYFFYRRPECFIYALYSKDFTDEGQIPQTQILLHRDKDRLSRKKFIDEVKATQADGLDLFISWNQDIKQSILMALKTVKAGGSVLIRVFDPSPNHLSLLPECFENMYLFKPMLLSPFTRERFLYLERKKDVSCLEQIALIEQDKVKTKPEVQAWIEYENSNLNQYAQDVQEGKFFAISSSKCYIKWNLPDHDPPSLPCTDNIPYQSLDAAGRKDNTIAFAETRNHNLYLAQPSYAGGWEYVTTISKRDTCPLNYIS